ncbi:MAG: glycosyltransferase [Dysgonamonadaceae bacterium]|jgi:glycosyltransferase involved in cell wall biosynthesis|nr:glycosyltransferase [Dysgonamonadaceae bacterium]
MFYSVIIPVYNRPDELDELLESLTCQTYTNFEIIVVDDGSSMPCKNIIEKYGKQLPVHYFYISNSGPGQARNYAAKESKGEYLIFLDSDCIVPPQYLASIEQEIIANKVDFFGGPDKAHFSFSNIQKAINCSMTSMLTTGGIRGGNKSIDLFYPRSFNMGIRKTIFEHVGGFSEMRFGEDIDFSIRVINSGYRSHLFTNSWVFHKRRTDLKKFFKQIFNSGMARINLYKRHPKSLKTVHFFPALFTLYTLISPFLSFSCWFVCIPFCLYSALIFVSATIKTKSIRVGLLSIIASFIQLFAYGSGFLYASVKNLMLKHNKNSAFDTTFYE